MPCAQARSEAGFATRRVEVRAGRLNDSARIDNERAIKGRKFTQGFEELWAVNSPLSGCVTMAGVEDQLAQVRRSFLRVSKHKDRANRMPLTALDSKLDGNIQEASQLLGL
jgi:hypothetical protein